MVLNSYENIRRRQSGFSHTRCQNVARSSVFALFKIGEAIIDTVQNIVTAIKAGVQLQEIVWKDNGITICVEDLKSLDGFDHDKDCEGKLDPLIDLLLSAANRDIIGLLRSVPPRINLVIEEHCIERRLMDYTKAVVLNNPSKVSKYAIMCATVEALIEVSGIEATLHSLCTSSIAKALSSNKNFYGAMQLESLLGFNCLELASFSLPRIGTGNKDRTRRTQNQVSKACELVVAKRSRRMSKEEELYHDPEILKRQYVTDDLELDLLRISDHLIQSSKIISHNTEIRLLNLLAIGGELIQERLEGEQKRARFYGTIITAKSDGPVHVESDSGISPGFVNLKALTSHAAVFGAMLSFMLAGPKEGLNNINNPVRSLADRTIFVQNTFKRFQAQGLSQAHAIETAVMAAKVLSIRRSTRFAEKVIADESVIEALGKVRGCFIEESTCTRTGMDIAELVIHEDDEDIEHYGADSKLLCPVSRLDLNLKGGAFQLLDYTKHCVDLYGKLEVHEAAVAFSHEGRKYFAYCRKGRVHIRKRGFRE